MSAAGDVHEAVFGGQEQAGHVHAAHIGQARDRERRTDNALVGEVAGGVVCAEGEWPACLDGRDIVQVCPLIAGADTDVGRHPGQPDIEVVIGVRHPTPVADIAVGGGREGGPGDVIEVVLQEVAFDFDADAVSEAIADTRLTGEAAVLVEPQSAAGR
jgi:hypothetical protein